MNFLSSYFRNIVKGIKHTLLGLDCLLNAICLGDGDEYISSRVGKRRDDLEQLFATIIDKFFFWDQGHTKESIQPDEGDDATLK